MTGCRAVCCRWLRGNLEALISLALALFFFVLFFFPSRANVLITDRAASVPMTADPLSTHDLSTFETPASAARLYARSDEPILLLGERGTGKSTLARRIHDWSGRSGRFVAHAVGGAADDIAIDALLGHGKGSFTGAASDRTGLVATAADGTLLLDELGAASPGLQVALLALFDRGAVRRIGEDAPLAVSARLIGATNADLDAEARAGRFRPDLLDRFGEIRITLPPLRARRSQIGELFRGFLQAASGRLGRRTVVSIDDDVHRLLTSYWWPGNIRELEHVANAAAILLPHGGGTLGVNSLPERFLRRAGASAPTDGPLPAQQARSLLDHAGGNVSRAARTMGVSRTTFYKYLGRD
ncbi:MAG: sigma-54-dependent Fis family transcriptional regulator [Gemmatimonadales bacterium]|nr:sigma-54-dependent Fis family transcriptional regulator [Gemmatimonadales bacterium]